MARKKLAAPEWQHWQHVQTVTLWEGVVLSLDIDPHDISYPGDSRLDDLAREHEAWKQVRGRFLVACRNVGLGGRLLDTLYRGDSYSKVQLRDFVAWSLSVGWDIPKELAAVADEQPKAGRWPWGDYETEMLRHLEAAARKWWVNYDPSDHTTAPTKAQVMDWLQSDRGLTQNDAEAIARILRADGLPQGPRR